MTSARRTLLLAALAAASGAALVAPGAASACSCLRLGPGDALRGATDVFAGTAVATREGALGVQRVTTFRVDARVKGRAARRQAVTAPVSSAACGIPFRVGRRYLVFARRDAAGRLSTDLCSGTREAPRRGASADALVAAAQCPAAVQTASSPTA